MLPLQSTQKSATGGKSYFLFILIAIVAIGSGLMVQSSKTPPTITPEFKKTILLPNSKPLVDVNFLDHKGQPFGIEKFKGKWSILFFGFTNCPDVCPTTMQTLKQVKASVEKAGVWHNYQVIMVSVDPERDTTERLASYVPYFDSEFIGVSGPLDSTTSFAKNVGILFYKSGDIESGAYDVDHGASIILVNPNGEYAGVITAPHLEATISQDLIALADYAGVKPNVADAASDKMGGDTKSDTNQANPSETNQGLVFEKAWIRPAPPGVTNMAAYFDLTNKTDQEIIIEQSNSTAFEMTMIHTTVVENGLTSMKHMKELTIPANGTVTLAPLGIHMMLMGPKQPLVLGDSAQINLVDKNGLRYSQTVTVQEQPK